MGAIPRHTCVRGRLKEHNTYISHCILLCVMTSGKCLPHSFHKCLLICRRADVNEPLKYMCDEQRGIRKQTLTHTRGISELSHALCLKQFL